jgi:hypothetical protein
MAYVYATISVGFRKPDDAGLAPEWYHRSGCRIATEKHGGLDNAESGSKIPGIPAKTSLRIFYLLRNLPDL